MNKLREARTLKGLTQFDLRIATGIHQSKISLLENQLVEPRADEKKRLAKVLKIPVEELFPTSAGRETLLTSAADDVVGVDKT